ncbi:MAG: PQQ-like beta-propeller repeat protein [Polyangiaceae bacterium]|nr:PQQ-like beta-propeller repeat protein [Polyangiaceae bacterium]
MDTRALASRTPGVARFLLVLPIAGLLASISCRQVLDLPETTACETNEECSSPDFPCLEGECIEGLCAYGWKAEGTVIDDAEAGDCVHVVCDSSGEPVEEVAENDAPADQIAGDCTAPACDSNGEVVQAPSNDAPADQVAGDCAAPACDAEGNIVDTLSVNDAPADEVMGDCSAPACDASGSVIDGPNDDDVPSDDPPGDCVRPACDSGAITTTASNDPPIDMVPGDCMSPSCDDGGVIDVPNMDDTPVANVEGDCLSPTCDGNGVAIDNTDWPTTGCGECLNGQPVDWADLGANCYSGDSSTLNVGTCHGGTWQCINDQRACTDEVTPTSEKCGDGFNGFDEDCNGQTDEGGVGCDCVLGTTAVCYSGPAQTQNVGTCDDGVSTCTATPNGNILGPCIGEVLPQECDSCIQAGDQDCSGSVESCTGSHVWSKPATFFGTTDLAVLPGGDFLAAISLFGGTTVGSSTVSSDGFSDIAIARYDANGNGISAASWGGAAMDGGGRIAAHVNGYSIAGNLGSGSSENFGSGPALTAVGHDGFIARFDSNGSLLWKKLLGDASDDFVTGVAHTPDDGVIVCGEFQGSINLGGSTLTSAGGSDMFVVRFDAQGNHVWSKRFGSSATDTGPSISVGSNGDAVLSGTISGNTTFGGPTIAVAGGKDGYIARLDANGTHLWTRAIQSATDDIISKAVVLSDGSVWAFGTFSSAVNLDGVAGTDISPTSTGADILMVKYSSSGSYLQSQSANGTENTDVNVVELGFDNSVVIGGSYSGTLYLNAFASPAAGGRDMFLYKINPGGSILWSKKYGAPGTEKLEALALGPCGDVLASSTFAEPVNFGGGTVTPVNSLDNAYLKYRQ